jgi:imidazolonepropionase-like amidohydrolase
MYDSGSTPPQRGTRAIRRAGALAALLSALTPALPAGAQQADASGTVLIQRVRVFDGETVIPRTSVLVRDGRIALIAPMIKVSGDVPLVDGEGKTLVPGLIDSHTHSWGTALRDAAALGVTTVLDMFTEPKLAAEYRRVQGTSEGRDLADFRSAGVLATSPKGHGTEYGIPIPTISSPGEAQAFVDARLAEGSDYIKIIYDDGHAYGMKIPTIDKATMKAVIDAAHARHKLAVVHIGDENGARDAIEAGADGLAHLFVDRGPDADFAALVKSHRAFVIPTLTVLESIAGEQGGATLVKDARLAAFIPPDNAANLARGFGMPKSASRTLEAALATVKQLRAAGVPILAGTDAPNPGTAHGASMHRELELLVRAGLTPVEALRAATSVPARTFGLADRGRIAKGMRADLVLVNGDPTTDILATRDIARVWKQGREVDRESYRAAVSKAAAEMAAGKFAVPPGSESGEVSDFDEGKPTAKFGAGWLVSTDQLAGGKSTAAMKVVPEGANGSAGALEIAGTLDGGLAYGWAGVMYMPGRTPMAPADLSAKKELSFRVKGDGKQYAVMAFTRSHGQMPSIQRFTARAEWTEVTLKLSDFDGTDAHDLMGIAFVASGTPGAFRLLLDDVRLR